MVYCSHGTLSADENTCVCEASGVYVGAQCARCDVSADGCPIRFIAPIVTLELLAIVLTFIASFAAMEALSGCAGWRRIWSSGTASPPSLLARANHPHATVSCCASGSARARGGTVVLALLRVVGFVVCFQDLIVTCVIEEKGGVWAYAIFFTRWSFVLLIVYYAVALLISIDAVVAIVGQMCARAADASRVASMVSVQLEENPGRAELSAAAAAAAADGEITSSRRATSPAAALEAARRDASFVDRGARMTLATVRLAAGQSKIERGAPGALPGATTVTIGLAGTAGTTASCDCVAFAASVRGCCAVTHFALLEIVLPMALLVDFVYWGLLYPFAEKEYMASALVDFSNFMQHLFNLLPLLCVEVSERRGANSHRAACTLFLTLLSTCCLLPIPIPPRVSLQIALSRLVFVWWHSLFIIVFGVVYIAWTWVQILALHSHSWFGFTPYFFADLTQWSAIFWYPILSLCFVIAFAIVHAAQSVVHGPIATLLRTRTCCSQCRGGGFCCSVQCWRAVCCYCPRQRVYLPPACEHCARTRRISLEDAGGTREQQRANLGAYNARGV